MSKYIRTPGTCVFDFSTNSSFSAQRAALCRCGQGQAYKEDDCHGSHQWNVVWQSHPVWCFSGMLGFCRSLLRHSLMMYVELNLLFPKSIIFSRRQRSQDLPRGRNAGNTSDRKSSFVQLGSSILLTRFFDDVFGLQPQRTRQTKYRLVSCLARLFKYNICYDKKVKSQIRGIPGGIVVKDAVDPYFPSDEYSRIPGPIKANVGYQT